MCEAVRDQLRDAIYFFEYVLKRRRRRRRGSEVEQYIEEAKRVIGSER
jgi:hypothetical protein